MMKINSSFTIPQEKYKAEKDCILRSFSSSLAVKIQPAEMVVPLQKGLNLFHAHLNLKRDIIMETKCADPVLEFGCLLSGKIEGDSKTDDSKIAHWGGDSGHTWVSYANYSQSTITYFSGEPIQAVIFQISSPLLETFSLDNSQNTSQLEKINYQLPNGTAALTPLLSKIIGQVTKKSVCLDELDRLFLISKSYELLFCLQQEMQNNQQTHFCASSVKPVDRAVNMIQQNLEESLSLEQIAREAGLCSTGLNIAFKKAFGTTVFGYIRQQRLDKAKMLIENKGKTVSEAAWESGYQSLSSFHRAFYAQYDVAPGSFSKKIR